MVSPAGRTLVERYCEADILVWDYEVDAGHPGWATTQIRTGEGGGREARLFSGVQDRYAGFLHTRPARRGLYLRNHRARTAPRPRVRRPEQLLKQLSQRSVFEIVVVIEGRAGARRLRRRRTLQELRRVAL